MREVFEIVGLQGVLVLRTTKASTHAEILDSLQVQSGAGNLRGLRANASDDLIGADFALAERLELSEHARGAATAAAASEGRDGVDGWILQDDVGEDAHLLRHGGEGQVLIALDEAGDAAGVLLREEALRSPHKEINIQAHGAQGEQQDQKLMTENPVQRNVVNPEDTIESILGKTVETIVPAGFVAEEAGAHHGRGGEGNKKRNTDGDAQHDGEFAEEAADDAAHQQNRDEDGDERSAHGEDGEADFAGAFHGGFKGLHAVFDVAGNVFDDHDGVVNDEARGDGEGHEREIVQAIVSKIHDAKRVDEGERNGHARNDGGPDVPEKSKHDENDERDGNHKRDFHVVDGSANRGGAVDDDAQVQRGRDRSAQQREEGGDAIHGFDHIGAGLPENGKNDGRFAAGEAQIAGIFDGIDNFSHIAQAHGSALMARDNQRLIFVRLEELIGVGNGPSLLGVRERSLRKVRVGRPQRAANLFEADSVAVELIGVHFDAHGGA